MNTIEAESEFNEKVVYKINFILTLYQSILAIFFGC